MDARGALLALIIQQTREQESTKEVTGKKEDKDITNCGKKFKEKRKREVETSRILHSEKSRLNNTVTVKMT